MVKNIWKSGSKLLTSRQNSVLSAAVVLMVMVLFSRLLGLVRDRLLAGAFFANQGQWQLDVYFAAFRIPDMIFQLLVMGALSAAFIPVYSSYLKKKEDQSWELVNGVISFASIAFVVLAILIIIFSYPLCRFLAPNFSPQQIYLMVSLTRLMLIAQFFFMISNFFTGLLQSHQRFLLPAIAPIMYNLGIILGTVFLVKDYGIYGPTIGVIIGSLLHLLIQYPLVKKIGFSFKPYLNIYHKGVRRIGKLMIPRTAALAVNQIELNVAVILASAMSAGSLSILNFAEHLNAVPIGLFGLTIGQAALPMLSKEADDNHSNQKFKIMFLSSFKHILYFALPASIMLLVLRIPLVRIAFGAKEFPWEATLLTAKVLAAFSLSIVAQAVIQLLVRAFYALQDTVTPLIIGGISVFINVFLSLLFIRVLGMDVAGLGLAISIAGIIQASLLFTVLTRKIGGFSISDSLLPFVKMMIATVLTGISLWVPMRFLDEFILDTSRNIDLIILTAAASACGLLVYTGFSKILKIEELDHFLNMFKRFGAWKKVFSQTEEVLMETSASAPGISSQD
jgi:putative peptidoglycan lipid II flippase